MFGLRTGLWYKGRVQRRSILSGSFLLSTLLSLASFASAVILALFILRRWLFLAAALLSPRRRPARDPEDAGTSTVLLLVPVHSEAKRLPALLPALARLDYPSHALTIVFVDDASTDNTAALVQAFINDRSQWHLLALPRRVGKAAALNEAIARFSQGELVAVYDADERPRSDALKRLVTAFGDPLVGAVSGRRAVANPLVSSIAAYATYENVVHQLVTMQAKETLRLAPAILGSNCVYRRAALEGVGGFRPGALLEDSDLTLRLARDGWRLRFLPGAVSFHAVPQTANAYWRQHRRWHAGFQAVARQQGLPTLADRRLPRLLRLELMLFSLGYADRLALLAFLGTGILRPGQGWRQHLRRSLLFFALLAPFAQTALALYRARAPRPLWLRMPLLPLFFLLDAAAAMAGTVSALLRSPVPWRQEGQQAGQ